MFNSISILELKKTNPINIIDIRSIEKYNENHIPDAINIDFNKLLIQPQKYLNKNEVYYIYCQRGIQSKKLCQVLINYEYRVVNIIGGYESYILSK